MKARYLMSLDLGGGGGRALLLNTDNLETTFITCNWAFSVDPEAGQFSFDLGGQEKWSALCQLSQKALKKASVEPEDVVGISVTSMRHGMVVLDKEGNVLVATPNKDARAIAESMDINSDYGDLIYHKTGHIPNPILLVSRLAWIKNNHPAYLADGATVLTISDWMAFMLSGERISEPTQAAETGIFDLSTSTWSEEIMHSLGLSMDLLPRIVWPGTPIGGLTPKAAEALGLSPGIPVASGGADTQLGLLGMGMLTPQSIGIIAGSTSPVMAITDRLVIDSNCHTWTGAHVLPGLFVVESNAGNIGSSLEWIAGILYADTPRPIAALSGDALTVLPGASGMISNLGAQLFNASDLVLPVDGITFSTMAVPTGLQGRASLARAVLEGMAYSIKHNAEQALAVAGFTPEEIFIGGGMARSPLWTQIVCDIFNLPVRIGCEQLTSSLGAAICAAVGSEMYQNLTDASKGLVKNLTTLQPSRNASQYVEHYQTWKDHQQARQSADAIASGAILTAMQESMDADLPVDVSFRPKIYVSANAGEEAVELLKGLGEVTYQSYSDTGNVLIGEELAETLQGYQVLVTEVDPVDVDALQQVKDLRVIVACRGNPVNVDINACTAAGIPVINTPGRNADAVADLTVSFMLMLLRKLDKASAFLREPGGEAGDIGRMGQAYFTFKGNELWQKTVGIIGGGAIGRKVIQRLRPFGAELIIFDPYLTDEEASLIGAIKVDLDDLLSQSDLITLHAPVTDETQAMINKAAFDRMKPGAFLINTARAALVDHEALLQALSSGKLGGAAFDVFPVEPPGSEDPLLSFENVIATPHIGGNTSEVGIHQGKIIIEELSALLSGQNPKFVLNPETLANFSWHTRRDFDHQMLDELAKGPGPGMTDLDLKAKTSASESTEDAEKSRSKSILGKMQRLVGSKPKDVQEPASPEPTAAPQADQARKIAEAHYAQVLEAFLTDLSTNPEPQAFARNKNVSFQFLLKHTDLAFFMRFADSDVTTGLGEAPFKPDVTIKMDADTFDGMFTGRIDGQQAFKSGKLSVSGNMLKAMTMQKLNFGPIYASTCEAMGGPGDLILISTPTPSTSSPLTSTPQIAPVVAEQPAPSFEVFHKIIQTFVESMPQDQETIEFSKKKNVTFQYIIKDAGINFYTGFINGQVITGMGESPEKADVTIKTDAATLDGMFTGAIDGVAAFKSGKLSVSGNMMKAMLMQKLNYHGQYSRARSQVGDPGLQGSPTPAEPEAPFQPENIQKTTVPVVIHKTGDIRDLILEVNNELYQRGWITSTGGNISARSENNPDEIWITPSGLFKGDLRADMMVMIDLDGNILGDPPYNASSERKVHCAIYKNRPEIQAVVHTHAIYATLMALTGTQWQPISADAAFFGDIPAVPFIMPGSSELGDEVAKAIGTEGVAVIMQNHGLVVAGSDLRRAADTTEAIETTAQKLLWCRNLGVSPEVLPGEIVSILADLGNMLA